MLTGRKLALTLAFAGLLVLAFGSACRGFFVKPTLSSLTVTPGTATVETGSTSNTQQFSAFGTYNDGSTGNPAVTWTSSDTTVATISTTGLATSVSTGTSTITATATQNPTITGTAALTVTVGCIQSITLSPASTITLSASVSGQNTAQIEATANTCNGQFKITDTATWTSSNTAAATVVGGLVTAQAQGSAGITASAGNVTSAATPVIVNP
jgi:hypothetical protein